MRPSITERNIRGGNIHHPAARIHHPDGLDGLLHFAQARACIHHDAPRHGPGNPNAPFQAGERPSNGISDQRRHAHAPFCIEHVVRFLADGFELPQANHDPADAPVTNEHIGPAHHKDRNVFPTSLCHHPAKVLHIGRLHQDFGRSTDVE